MIRTRDGRPVRILSMDRKDYTRPVVALVQDNHGQEQVMTYHSNNAYFHNGVPHPADIIDDSTPAPNTHTGFVETEYYLQGGNSVVKIKMPHTGGNFAKNVTLIKHPQYMAFQITVLEDPALSTAHINLSNNTVLTLIRELERML